jgi:hypothetical protein
MSDKVIYRCKKPYYKNHTIISSRKEASGLGLLTRVLYTQDVACSSPAPPTFFLGNQEMGSINNCQFLNYNDVLISYPGP